LELDEVNDYDLVILDLNLPGLDGIEVCRRMRAARPALLILMLTARERLADRILGLDAGADDYLVKPFHLAELTARLRALLRRDLRVRAPFLEWRDLRLDQAGRIIWLVLQLYFGVRTCLLDLWLLVPRQRSYWSRGWTAPQRQLSY